MPSPTLKKQSTELFFGKVSSFIIQIITPVILVRVLSRDEYGIYQQFLLAGATAVNIFGMGLNGSLYYFYPVSKENQRQTLLFQTHILQLLQGAGFFIILWIFHERLLKLLNFQGLDQHYLFLGLYVILFIGSTLIDNIFTLEKKVIYNRYFFSIDKLFRSTIVVIFAILTKSTMACIIALVIYACARFLYTSIYMLLHYYRFRFVCFSIRHIKEQILYSIPFAGAILVDTISKRFDKFLINVYITPQEFAVYSVAFLSIPILNELFTSIYNVAMPQIVIYAEQDKVKEIGIIWHKIITKSASVAIPAIIFFAVMADELIELLYTQQYLGAANLYRIYLLSFLFSMTAYGMVLRAYKKTGIVFRANVLGTIITISLGYFLIRFAGVQGGVITALLGIACPIIIMLIHEKKLLSLTVRTWLPWKDLAQNFSIVLLPGMALFTVKFLNLHIFFTLVIGGIIFFPTVVLLQYKSGIFIYPEMLVKISSFCKRYVTNCR